MDNRTNNNPWFIKHEGVIRWMLLVFLIVSMLAPWTFDQINVPAEYTCSPPNVRLYGDFCGLPLSGFFVSFMGTGGFISLITSLASGTFEGRSREFIVGLYLFIIFPIFTTIILIWKKETRRLRTLNLVAWILALIPALLMVVLITFQRNEIGLKQWGSWLYTVTAIGAISLELTVRRAGSRPVKA